MKKKKEERKKNKRTNKLQWVFSSRNPVRNSFRTRNYKQNKKTISQLLPPCAIGPLTLKHLEFLSFPSWYSTLDIILNLQAVNIPLLLLLFLLSAVACSDKGSCCKSPVNSLMRTAPVGLAFGEVPASSAGIFSCSEGSIHCTRSQTCKHSEQISSPSLTSGREQRACTRLRPSLIVSLCYLWDLQVCS